MTVIPLALDLQKIPEGKPPAHILGRQGDTDIVIQVTVTNYGETVDFTGKYLAFSMMRNNSWIEVTDGCTQVEGNVWRCTLPDAATAYDGEFKLCYFVVHDSEDITYRQATQSFTIMLDRSATATAHLGNYSDEVDRLIAEMEIIKSNYESQLAAQAAEFAAAQQAREAAYNSAESARDSQYTIAEGTRDTQYANAESARDSAFASAEETRNSQSAAAASAANSAASSANAAAQKVEDALSGDLDAVFKDYLDQKTDVSGGFVGYDTYIAGLAAEIKEREDADKALSDKIDNIAVADPDQLVTYVWG